jgi:hypothetical protein
VLARDKEGFHVEYSHRLIIARPASRRASQAAVAVAERPFENSPPDLRLPPGRSDRAKVSKHV